MISFSTTSSDTRGNVVIQEMPGGSDFKTESVKIVKTLTLDGGVTFNNSGYFQGNRVFNISAKLTVQQESLIRYMFQNYALVLCSCNEGLYLGAIQQLKNKNGKMTMVFWVKSKEND